MEGGELEKKRRLPFWKSSPNENLPRNRIRMIPVGVDVTRSGRIFEVSEIALAKELANPSNTEYWILDVFNTPNEISLDLSGNKTRHQLEIYLELQRREFETRLKTVDIHIHFDWLFNVKCSSGYDAIASLLISMGNLGWSLRGIHDPVPVASGFFSCTSPAQLIFQKPSAPTGVKIIPKVKRFEIRPDIGCFQIIDLVPKIHKYGLQGFRVTASLNPPESRTLQSRRKNSFLFLFLEKEIHPPTNTDNNDNPNDNHNNTNTNNGDNNNNNNHDNNNSVTVDERTFGGYAHKVERKVLHISKGAAGKSIAGSWAECARMNYDEGWTLATIMDVCDEINGIITLFLVFHKLLALHKTPASSATTPTPLTLPSMAPQPRDPQK